MKSREQYLTDMALARIEAGEYLEPENLLRRATDDDLVVFRETAMASRNRLFQTNPEDYRVQYLTEMARRFATETERRQEIRRRQDPRQWTGAEQAHFHNTGCVPWGSDAAAGDRLRLESGTLVGHSAGDRFRLVGWMRAHGRPPLVAGACEWFRRVVPLSLRRAMRGRLSRKG